MLKIINFYKIMGFFNKYALIYGDFHGFEEKAEFIVHFLDFGAQFPIESDEEKLGK